MSVIEVQTTTFKCVPNLHIGWTKEDLLQIHLIRHALIASAVEFDVDFGVTDEGDPWLVFCQLDGEVIVHIAYFDGLYRLFGCALRTPLSGRSFPKITRSLIGTIARRQSC